MLVMLLMLAFPQFQVSHSNASTDCDTPQSYLPFYDVVTGSPSKIQNVLSVFVLGLTGLTHLDLFGARITDSGTNHLRSKFSNV